MIGLERVAGLECAATQTTIAPVGTNLIPFPGTEMTTADTAVNANHRPSYKSEVYPFKDPREVELLQRYFLEQYKKATTDTKRQAALRNWLWFVLGINMGWRGGDISELKWGQLLTLDYQVRDTLYTYIQEQKTGKFRELICNGDCKQAIQFYLRESSERPSLDDYIFASQKGDNLSRVAYGRILQKAANAVGIQHRVGTHSLRKTFGYNLYRATGDLALVQYALNHSSSAVTLRYIGIMSDTLHEAYENICGSVQTGMLEEFAKAK